ncbi:MAG: RIP metalloprotease RseP [Clostridiales bacterium]|nr:RIP metalloprotease RseP [Clostridiales bacterium]
MSLISVVITVLIFCIIVIIHEGGHFAAARLSGVTVEEFAIGMGKKICSVTKGGVMYSVRCIPLGGFCRMADNSDPETGVQGFLDANVFKRIFICIAGPFMNFVLAIIVLSFINFSWSYTTTELSGVVEGYPAAEAGIQEGDRIVSINGKKVATYSELTYEISKYQGQNLDVVIERDGEQLEFSFVLSADEEGAYKMGVMAQPKAGFLSGAQDSLPETEFFEAVYCGWHDMFFLVKMTIVGLGQLFTAQVSMDDVAGPIGLTTVVGEVYSESASQGFWVLVVNMLNITALLSANLGVMNLLPIPALDGGKIFVYLIEILRRKPIAPEKEGAINLIGFVLIMGFGLVVAFHDVFKIFS